MAGEGKASTPYGVIPAAPTPFTPEGEIDEAKFRAEIRFFVEQGVHGIAVGGSTGEGATLTPDEVRRLVSVALEEVDGRIPVVAGNIPDSTREAVAKGKAVADLGVSALMTTPVHYHGTTEDGMVAYFKAVSEEVGLPVIIYNVVARAYLSLSTLGRIFREVPGVIGVKQSLSDMRLLAQLLAYHPDKLIYSAVDWLLYPSFLLGSHGTIAALPAAAPGQTVALWDAVKRGDHALALEIHKRFLALWDALEGPNLPACVKYALELQGCPTGHPRAPMTPPSPGQRQAIERAVKALSEGLTTATA